jgi:hypothetical protein
MAAPTADEEVDVLAERFGLASVSERDDKGQPFFDEDDEQLAASWEEVTLLLGESDLGRGHLYISTR